MPANKIYKSPAFKYLAKFTAGAFCVMMSASGMVSCGSNKDHKNDQTEPAKNVLPLVDADSLSFTKAYAELEAKKYDQEKGFDNALIHFLENNNPSIEDHAYVIYFFVNNLDASASESASFYLYERVKNDKEALRKLLKYANYLPQKEKKTVTEDIISDLCFEFSCNDLGYEDFERIFPELLTDTANEALARQTFSDLSEE